MTGCEITQQEGTTNSLPYPRLACTIHTRKHHALSFASDWEKQKHTAILEASHLPSAHRMLDNSCSLNATGPICIARAHSADSVAWSWCSSDANAHLCSIMCVCCECVYLQSSLSLSINSLPCTAVLKSTIKTSLPPQLSQKQTLTVCWQAPVA